MCSQPYSYFYLILSLVSGATSLYFFHDEALLFLAWYMLIVMAEIHERYGQQCAMQVTTVPEIEDFETVFAAALSQLPESKNASSESNDASQPLETELPSNDEFTLRLPAWPETSMASTDASTPWQSSSPPPELDEFPSDESLPVEILNIVLWSLIRPNAREASSRQDDSSSPELLAQDFAYLQTAITDNAMIKADDNGHDVIPVHSGNGVVVARTGNLSKERGREKVQNLRSSLKASMIDFASELRDSLELTRRAKAILEAKEREQTHTVECTSCFVSSFTTFAFGCQLTNIFLGRYSRR
jgi:hypothetical protein